MTKTKALRGVISEILLQAPGGVYHRAAGKTAVYPYKVYTLQRADLGDLARDDYDLCVDIWDRGPDPSRVEEIADTLSGLFNARNEPTDDVLPTFFGIVYTLWKILIKTWCIIKCTLTCRTTKDRRR